MNNTSRRMRAVSERVRSFLLDKTNYDRVFAFLCATFLPLVFSFTSFEGMREPKAKMFCFMVGLYLSLMIIKEVSKALGFAFLYMVSMYYYAETGFIYEDFLIFICCIYSCFLVKNVNDDSVRFIMKTLEWMGLFFGAYGCIQMIGLDPVQTYHSWADHRPTAFFGQHTLYAPIAAVCFASALLQKHYVMASLLLVPAFLIDSSFSYLGFGLAVLIFFVKEFGWKVVFAPILLILCLFIMKKVMYDSYRELYNDRGRFRVWQQTMELANRRPYFGYGASSFKQIYPVFQNPELRKASGIKMEELSPVAQEFMKTSETIAIVSGHFFTPHNEYLTVLFEYGRIGLLFLIAVLFTFYASFFLNVKSTETWFLFTIVSIFAGNSVGNFTLHLIPQALFPLWAFVVMTTRRNWSIMEVYGYTRNIRIIPFRRNSV